ncbi:MAG: ATP-binding protein [Chloroflexi bacterium]|nr:ATP-binding protein [Chloroflexota bacterium]
MSLTTPTTLTLGRDLAGEVVQLVIPAPAAGRPPGVLLVGQPGTGKTSALRQIGQEAARAGSRVVNVAPLDLSFAREDEIDLTNPEALPGVLDPLKIAPRGLREQITTAALFALLQPAREWEAPIATAVHAASVRRGGGDLGDVIDALRASTAPAARDAARALAVFADYGLARLLFPTRVQRSNASAREWRRSGAHRHKADPAAVAAVRDHVLTQPITTIRLPLVDPPADYRVPASDHSTDECVAAATAILLATYALRLAASTPTHTLVLFDSLASAVIHSTRGRRVFSALARTAQAHNTTLALTTLRPDAAASLAPLFASRIAFAPASRADAKHTAELLGLNDEELWIERMRSYRPGQCMLRDHTGRLTELEVDTPPTLVA